MPLPRCPMRTEEEGATGGGGPPGSAGYTERQLPAPPAGLRVWIVSSALTCVLFPGSECPSSPGPHPPSSPALWNLSCRPPTAPCGSQGCCPHSPRPELSGPAPALRAWCSQPFTMAKHFLRLHHWTLGLADSQERLRVGPGPPQSGPSLSHRGRDQEKGGRAKGLGLERGQAPGQKGP